ncbi:MAG: DUF6505 family protein [Hyphomicrobiaceae bacterium]|nr:hypothetical protein [Hyphomicrobiaceae bacterium]
MRFLRTIRFDETDTRVFGRVAEPGEWAVPGGFEFSRVRAGELSGKMRQAFANGFLGVSSFGRSTFATVGEANADERAYIETALAQHFVDVYGAPDLLQARVAAREEMTFVDDLCASAALNTVLTLRRQFADNGEIREEFRVIAPPSQGPQHTRIWKIETDGT